MVKATPAFAPGSTNVGMNSLRTQEITFRSPFQTPNGNVLFLIENNSDVESELLKLFRENKLNREGIPKLARYSDLSDRIVQP
jgi:hypothetical protein